MAKNVKRYSQGGSFKNINIGGASALQQQRAHSQTVIQGLQRQRNAAYQRDKDAIQSAIEAERAEKEQRRINFNLTEDEYRTREKALERNSRRDRENTEQLKANLKQKAESIQAFSKAASEGFMFTVGKVAEAQAKKDFQEAYDDASNIQDDVVAQSVLQTVTKIKAAGAINAAQAGDPLQQVTPILLKSPKLQRVSYQKGVAQYLVENNTFSDILNSALREYKLDITDPDEFKQIGNQVVHAFYKAYGLDKQVNASHLSNLKQHTKGVVDKHVKDLQIKKSIRETSQFREEAIVNFQKNGVNLDGTLNLEALEIVAQGGYLLVDEKGEYGGLPGAKDAIKDLLESRHTPAELIALIEDNGISPNLLDPSQPGTLISKLFTPNQLAESAYERLKNIEEASTAVKRADKAAENHALYQAYKVIDSDDYTGTFEENENLISYLHELGVSKEGISKARLRMQTKGAQRDLIRAESEARKLINSGRFTVEDYNNLHPSLRSNPFFRTAKETASEFNRVLDSQNINITTLSVGRFKQLLKDKSVHGSDTPSVTLGAGLFEKTLRQNFNSRWHSELKKSIETRKSAEEVWSEVYKELDDLITKVNSDTNPDTTSPWYAERDPGEESATLPNILSRSSNTGPMSTLPQEKGYSIEALPNEPYRALWMPWVKPEYLENLRRANEYGQPLEIPEDVHRISELTGFPVHQLLNSWTKYYENNGVLQKGESFEETIQYKMLKQPDVQKSNALIQTMANDIKTYTDLQRVNVSRVFPAVADKLGPAIFQDDVP